MMKAEGVEIDKFIEDAREMFKLHNIGGLGFRVIDDGGREEMFFEANE